MEFYEFNYRFALLFSSFTSLALGIFVFFSNRKQTVNKIFFIFCLCIAEWSFCQSWIGWIGKENLVLLFGKLEHIGVILIPVLFLHFVVKLLNIKKAFILKSAYVIAIIFLLTFPSKLYLNKVIPNQFIKYSFFVGPLYILTWYYFLITVIYAERLFYVKYRKSTGTKKNQLKYLFWATIIGYIGGLSNLAYMYNLHFYPLNPFSNYLVPIFIFVSAYAIIKHQLMDIKVVIQKGLVYSLLVAFITATYLIFVMLLERLLHTFMGYSSLVASILAAFVIALFFNPVKDRIQKIIDRLFFKGTLSSLALEKERLEEEIRRSEKMKAVATLAAGMAHEIKNPLTSIKTFTEYLKENKDNPEFLEKFQRIVGSEVDKINNIVHGLLDFARPTPLKLQDCDIHQLLEDTFSLLTNDLLKKKVALVKEFNSTNPILNLDPVQIKQAFLNIILNALDAMPQGGILTIKTVDKEPGWVEISIKDTGAGIQTKDLPHIFDPFYGTKETGTGLGLSITHGIIKEHGGSIGVESKVGVRSEFIIELKKNKVTK
ncbi:MAG: ATP-binding protein [Candidatus Omnitrophota bacterium]